MRIKIIRHGKTVGNIEKKYVGFTDDPLSQEGILELKQLIGTYQAKDPVFVSPMSRCVDTARLYFPKQQLQAVEDLRECNFGRWEMKSAKELSDDQEYQTWIDSNGTLPFPEGESLETFSKRCVDGFFQVMASGQEDITIVAHGGTIMAILSALGNENKSYFDYWCENGRGYSFIWNSEKKKIEEIEKI